MKKNVVFIGMPGAGKSTIGVVIAKILGYNFIDSDLLIQADQGDILENLIARYGIEGFIEIENRVNESINVRRTVISTGGSVCYCDKAMEHFKESSVLIYLRLDYETIRKRVGDLNSRGVVIRKGASLKDLYDERAPLYEKYADLTIDLVGLPIRKSIDKVKNLILSNSSLFDQEEN